MFQCGRDNEEGRLIMGCVVLGIMAKWPLQWKIIKASLMLILCGWEKKKEKKEGYLLKKEKYPIMQKS